jgi:CheY-like chemotaxis protein
VNSERKRTILIVDDESDLRDAIAFDFKRKGFEILEAPGGRAAFQLIENNHVDLVITDVNMPDGNGIELLDRIKGARQTLPVFVFVAGAVSGEEISPETVYEKGAEAVFSKPFDRKELLEAAVRFMKKEEERFARAAPRLKFEVPTGVTFLESNFSLETRTADLGRGGMFLALQDKFPLIGERLHFRIAPPDESAPIQGEGIVRWIRERSRGDLPAGCGIEFLALDDAGLKLVASLHANHDCKSFIPRK